MLYQIKSQVTKRFLDAFRRTDISSQRILINQGLQLSLANASLCPSKQLRDSEFSIFSQWGEDGIIQKLLSHITVQHRSFVEFGVEDYWESNTRFLLIKDNWKGLVIDGGEENTKSIRGQSVAWRHHLDVVTSFITAENINGLLLSQGYSGELGLLSVDIDGNDYWVWKSINCIAPVIVVAEYNGLWGPSAEVTVPYDPNFARTVKHFSNVYYGASLQALISLGKSKGYTFVGSNSTGSNAFFLRNDMLGPFKERTAAEEYVPRLFRESRAENGALTLLPLAEQLILIGDLPLVDLSSGKTGRAKDLISLSTLAKEYAR